MSRLMPELTKPHSSNENSRKNFTQGKKYTAREAETPAEGEPNFRRISVLRIGRQRALCTRLCGENQEKDNQIRLRLSQPARQRKATRRQSAGRPLRRLVRTAPRNQPSSVSR